MKKCILAVIFAFSAMGAQAAAKQYSCEFPGYAEPLITHWSGDGAILIGNMGHEKVTPIKGTFGNVTFVEVTPTGTVQVMAILANGDAVYSRHTVFGPEEMMPSQVKGHCKITEM